MPNPILTRYLRPDGSYDLCAALCELHAGSMTTQPLRRAMTFLAELEDMTPIRNPESAAIAFTCANAIAQSPT